MSDTKRETQFTAAFCKALAEMPEVPRSKTVKVRTKSGGEYSFSYAPLDKIREIAWPIFAAHGLGICQTVADGAVMTVVMHEGGHSMRLAPVAISPTEQGAQAMGSALTYARRYSLQLALGIVAEEDDDGNASVGNVATRGSQQANGPQGDSPWTCPNCGNKTLFRGSKAVGGFNCWTSKGGCDAHFASWEQAQAHQKKPAQGAPPSEGMKKHEVSPATMRLVTAWEADPRGVGIYKIKGVLAGGLLRQIAEGYWSPEDSQKIFARLDEQFFSPLEGDLQRAVERLMFLATEAKKRKVSLDKTTRDAVASVYKGGTEIQGSDIQKVTKLVEAAFEKAEVEIPLMVDEDLPF